MRCFLLGFAGFFIATLVAVVANAAYSDYGARASLSESMLSVSSLRMEIAENIMKQRTVANAGASLKPSPETRSFPSTDYVKVTAEGTIVFRNSKHGQIVVLEPSFHADSVTWRCVGSKPEKNMQPDCR